MAIEVTIRWTRHPLTISREAEQRAAAAVMKAAHDIEGLAKRVVPVDTGNLKNSIQVAEDGEMAATIGPRGVEYDYYVEMGTRRMGARPYMRPAAEQVRPAFITAKWPNSSAGRGYLGRR